VPPNGTVPDSRLCGIATGEISFFSFSLSKLSRRSLFLLVTVFNAVLTCSLQDGFLGLLSYSACTKGGTMYPVGPQISFGVPVRSLLWGNQHYDWEGKISNYHFPIPAASFPLFQGGRARACGANRWRRPPWRFRGLRRDLQNTLTASSQWHHGIYTPLRRAISKRDGTGG
jgi:hypothetical protein